jgi:hypothetical protein
LRDFTTTLKYKKTDILSQISSLLLMLSRKIGLSRTRIITSQNNLLPLRRIRRIKRMMVTLCAGPLIVGQISAHTAKEENFHMSRRL